MKHFILLLSILVISNTLLSQQVPKTEKKQVITTKAPKPIGPYSQAIISGNMIYVSGQIPIDLKTGEVITNDIKLETETIMNYIIEILKESGSDISKILKTSIFLTDIKNFAQVNEVYAKYFDKSIPPARETIQVAALPKGARIEISVIASK